MENVFFRKCLPYKVEISGDNLLIFNRDYEVIYNVKHINESEASKILPKVAADRPDCVRSYESFLYDDNTNPIANEQGFNKYLMAEYLERLSILIKELAH